MPIFKEIPKLFFHPATWRNSINKDCSLYLYEARIFKNAEIVLNRIVLVLKTDPPIAITRVNNFPIILVAWKGSLCYNNKTTSCLIEQSLALKNIFWKFIADLYYYNNLYLCAKNALTLITNNWGEIFFIFGIFEKSPLEVRSVFKSAIVYLS